MALVQRHETTSAQLAAIPAAAAGTGLHWTPFQLPTLDGQTQTGYYAPDSQNPGQWLYFGPDQNVYRDPNPGEVKPNQLGNIVGALEDLPGMGYGASGSGATTSPGTTGTTTAPDPFASIASEFATLAAQNGAGAGANQTSDPNAQNDTALVPVAGTGGGAAGGSLLPIVLLAAVGLGIWWYTSKHHKGGGEHHEAADA